FGPQHDARLLLPHPSSRINGVRTVMGSDFGFYVVELLYRLYVIVQTGIVLGVIVNGVGVAQIAFGQQMGQNDDLMIRPFVVPFDGQMTRHSDLASRLEFVQLPPPLKGVEWVIGGGFDLA